MLDLFIRKEKDNKQIMLTDNGILVEHYNSKYIENRNEGNIFVGIVKNVLNSMEAAFIDIGTEKNSYIQAKDIIPQVDEKKVGKKAISEYNIKKLVRPNQKILVQVRKDSNDLKGARISAHITLPSKYIVFMPNTDIITVSQKITDQKEQERLIKIIRDNIGSNNGAVVRTSAVGKNQEIIDDINRVKAQWEKIYESFKNYKGNKPQKIYDCPSILEKMLIDLPSSEIDKIISNDKQELENIKRFVKQDTELSKVKFEFKKLEDIDETYDLQKQIEKNEKRKIWLKCGGFITIDPTEALTAIDVNTGKYTDGKNYSDVIFKVNQQATIEIAKQIRLKDIGGIIIIDYIDMVRKGDKEKIKDLLSETLKKDRAKTQVEGFTKLDLMELTRKHICSHKS